MVATASERSGVGVGVVAEVGDRLKDSFARCTSHGSITGRDRRHGSQRHASLTRNVVNPHRARPSPTGHAVTSPQRQQSFSKRFARPRGYLKNRASKRQGVYGRPDRRCIGLDPQVLPSCIPAPLALEARVEPDANMLLAPTIHESDGAGQVDHASMSARSLILAIGRWCIDRAGDRGPSLAT